MKNFNKIYKLAFNGEKVKKNDHVGAYEKFIWFLIDDEIKDRAFIGNWRYVSQQECMSYNRGHTRTTARQFLQSVYESYNPSKETLRQWKEEAELELKEKKNKD